MLKPRRIGLVFSGLVFILLGAFSVLEPLIVLEVPILAGVISFTSAWDPRWELLAGLLAIVLSIVAAFGLPQTPSNRVDGPAQDEQFRVLSKARGRRELQACPASEKLNAHVQRAIAGDEAALDAVRNRLRRLAIQALLSGSQDSRTRAERAIDAWTWTDDTVAAAFLSPARPREQKFEVRLRRWLDPEGERRRDIRRTIGAIEKRMDDDSIAAATSAETTGDRSTGQESRPDYQIPGEGYS